MLKKIVVSGAVVSLVAFLFFGTAVMSHVHQGVSWVRGQVKDSVPVEYELERANRLIEKTQPQIQECKNLIGRQMIEIKYLAEELDTLERETVMAKQTLQTQVARLDENEKSYFFYGRQVSYGTLKEDAKRRFTRIKAADSIVTSKLARLGALNKTLVATRKQLDELITRRQELTALAANLKAKLHENAAKKAMTLNIEVDDSDLAKAKKILDEVRMRLDVEAQVMENDRPLLDEMPSENLDDIDLTQRISAYLQGRRFETAPMDLPAIEASTDEVAAEGR